MAGSVDATIEGTGSVAQSSQSSQRGKQQAATQVGAGHGAQGTDSDLVSRRVALTCTADLVTLEEV